MMAFVSTVFWYLEEVFLLAATSFMILQGFRDETFGMPLLGVVLNLSWAFWSSFYVDTVHLVNQLHFATHLIILGQILVFGPKEFFAGQRLPLYGLLVACVLPCLGLMRALIAEEGQEWAETHLFYGCMLITSILFVHMLLSRGDGRGQHLMAAVFKCAGMLCFWIHEHSAVVNWLCLGILVADVVYMYLLYLCLEQPQTFRHCRNFLVSNHGHHDENDTMEPNYRGAGPLLSKMINADSVVYHPAPMMPTTVPEGVL